MWTALEWLCPLGGKLTWPTWRAASVQIWAVSYTGAGSSHPTAGSVCSPPKHWFLCLFWSVALLWLNSSFSVHGSCLFVWSLLPYTAGELIYFDVLSMFPYMKNVSQWKLYVNIVPSQCPHWWSLCVPSLLSRGTVFLWLITSVVCIVPIPANSPLKHRCLHKPKYADHGVNAAQFSDSLTYAVDSIDLFLNTCLCVLSLRVPRIVQDGDSQTSVCPRRQNNTAVLFAIVLAWPFMSQAPVYACGRTAAFIRLGSVSLPLPVCVCSYTHPRYVAP